MPKKKTTTRKKKPTRKTDSNARPDLLRGGLADGLPDSMFNFDQLIAGIKTELEHTRIIDPKTGQIAKKSLVAAKEIAKDHLVEIPDYYTRLMKMEHEAEQYWRERRGYRR